MSGNGIWFPLVPYQTPYLTLPNGTRIDLQVDGGIPYLSMDAVAYSTETMAAPVETNGQSYAEPAVIVGDVEVDSKAVSGDVIVDVIKKLTKNIIQTGGCSSKTSQCKRHPG